MGNKKSVIAPNVLFLGVNDAGKTTIIHSCVNDFTQPPTKVILPTIGHSVSHFKLNKVKFTVWDVPGREKFRDLWVNYYKDCQAVVFVIDAASENSVLSESRDLLTESILQHIRLKDKPVLVLANKQDLPNARSPVTLQELINVHISKRKKCNYMIFGCCAKTGEGLEEAFKWLATEIKKQAKPA